MECGLQMQWEFRKLYQIQEDGCVICFFIWPIITISHIYTPQPLSQPSVQMTILFSDEYKGQPISIMLVL